MYSILFQRKTVLAVSVPECINVSCHWTKTLPLEKNLRRSLSRTTGRHTVAGIHREPHHRFVPKPRPTPLPPTKTQKSQRHDESFPEILGHEAVNDRVDTTVYVRQHIKRLTNGLQGSHV